MTDEQGRVKVKVGRIKDPFMPLGGLWYVAVSEDNGKTYRIVFKDVYRSVCVEYARQMKEVER